MCLFLSYFNLLNSRLIRIHIFMLMAVGYLKYGNWRPRIIKDSEKSLTLKAPSTRFAIGFFSVCEAF